jgi:hypothetical protein
MFKVSIPEMPVKELILMYAHTKPVITIDGKLHYFRDFTLEELSGISYLWDKEKNVGAQVGENELVVWEDHDFACLHRYGHPALFKPSICEVLSQIRKEDANYVKAFEIIEHPETAEDFYKDPLTAIIFEQGFHVSTVRLYLAAR